MRAIFARTPTPRSGQESLSNATKSTRLGEETDGNRVGVRIAVFGTSELSAIYAASMAELGHEVLGVDIDVAKITALVNGEAPFYEPGLGPVP